MKAPGKVLHEADGYIVYLTEHGRIGFRYSGGSVQLKPEEWVNRFYAVRWLSERVEYFSNALGWRNRRSRRAA